MADRTEASIRIDADAAAVMAVVADVEAYPDWANGIVEAEVLGRGADGLPAEARFRIESGPVRDEYVIRYAWSDAEVSWTLVSAGVLSAMDGSYTLVPAAPGTDVTYRLTVDLSMPMIGMLKRRAERAVVDTALTDLKRRVEG